jgi:hypothetical protein
MQLASEPAIGLCQSAASSLLSCCSGQLALPLSNYLECLSARKGNQKAKFLANNF